MQVDQNKFDLYERWANQTAKNKWDKRIDTAAETDSDCSHPYSVNIYMHTDPRSPVFNLHLQCSRQVDGHPGKWNICPSLMQLTLWAPRQGKWKQTPQMSRSHGKNDLALWLKCFPPSPVWSATSIYQSNDVAKGQVNQAQLLLLSFETDSDAALSPAAAGSAPDGLQCPDIWRANIGNIFRIYQIQKELFILPNNTNISQTGRCLKGLFL